jgi:Flp pilus assembly pilin Flp
MPDRVRIGALRLLDRLRDQRGQTSVEWAGIAFVVVAVAGAIVALAPNIAQDIVNAIGNAIKKLV